MTEKQKIFADEYLIDLNATRAYKVAYPKVKKDKTAAQAGSRMLRNVKVERYIQERMQARQERTEITQDRVLEELAAIAFASATDYGKEYDIVPVYDLPGSIAIEAKGDFAGKTVEFI